MNDRYPFLRFVTDAAAAIAGAVAVIVFLGGTLRACHLGGGRGLVSFLVVVAIAAVAYVVVRVKIEVLRLLLDLESNTRQPPAAPSSVSPPLPPS